MSNALTLITGEINAIKDDFQNLLADHSIKFEQEAGFAIQILSGNSYSLSVAMNNRASVVNAVKNLAAIGISLNPAKKQAYLVPRRVGDQQAICLDISYMGLMDLAIQTGSIKWAKAELVRETDGFALNGPDKMPSHSFNPFSKDRGQIIGVYVVVKTADGDYLTHCMQIDDVYDIRDRSEAWKSYVAKKAKSCPWVTDPGEMIKKTCVKQASKYWPKVERLEQAIHHLNTDGGEGLQDIDQRPDNWIDVNPLIAQALKTSNDADALQFWREHNASLVNQPADYKKLKDAIAAHRAKLAEDARTIDMPAAAAEDTAATILADMEAAADGGTDAFTAAWVRLSKATQEKLQPHYESLSARAAQVPA